MLSFTWNKSASNLVLAQSVCTLRLSQTVVRLFKRQPSLRFPFRYAASMPCCCPCGAFRAKCAKHQKCFTLNQS